MRLPLFNLRLSTNHAPLPDGHAVAIGLAVNHATGAPSAPGPLPATGDGWLLLAPYGETPYWHHDEGQPGSGLRRFRQVFTHAQAERMAAAFNTLAARKGEGFRGLPIYSGHPDADPQRWPDERRLGGVVAVEARADGLYVRAAWNDLGEKNRTEGYLVYPSPAWLYDVRAARASGVIAPDELRSVGLTNTPRIQEVPAWTNADPTFPSTDPNKKHPATMDYKQALLDHLGLSADTSDADLVRALESARAATATAANPGREEADRLTADAARFRAAAVNAQLDAALGSGRLSAAERSAFARRFDADYDAAAQALAERTPALNTQGLSLRPTGAGTDLSTAQGRSAAFNARIDALMRPVSAGGRGLKFDAAVAALRANPEDAALLRAMETAAV